MKRGIPLKRGPSNLRRSKLRKVGARAKREAATLKGFREAVLADHECWRCGERKQRLECHHVVNRARAAGWARLHDPEINGVPLCNFCHRAMTLDPHDCGFSVHLEKKVSKAFAMFEAWRARGGKA